MIVEESKIERISVVCDKMEMLHRPDQSRGKMKKQGSLLRRQKLQVPIENCTRNFYSGFLKSCDLCILLNMYP